ncbi:AAA family ATPase [Vibrio cholerae]|nr:AAA family ATPase [Vibrio cholerae]EJL6364718.1 AAA family ATPase [Vibrio cholerae]
MKKKSGKKLWSDLMREFEYDSEIPANLTEVGEIEYSNGNKCQLIVPLQSQAQYQLQYQNQMGITGLNIPSHRPIMGYFQIQNIPTNPKTNQQHYDEFKQLQFQAYGSDSVRNPGVVLKQSLIALALFGTGNQHVQPNVEYRSLFDEFQNILRMVLPKSIGFKRLEIRTPDIILITETGDFPLDAMSGGVSAIFGMAWQIHVYGADKSGCTVIIDEPENHLHPSMQREFLTLLRKAFPTYRFIVSTNSPFIVSSDPEASVYGLIYSENKKIISRKLTQADLTGSPNKILREILDVPTTLPIWVEEKIRTVLGKYENISDTEDKAGKIINDLKELGLNNSLTDFLG